MTNLSQILLIAFLSMVPTFEGRYAVVAAIGTGMPVLLAKDPMECTVFGLGFLLENMQLMPSGSRMTSTARRGSSY